MLGCCLQGNGLTLRYKNLSFCQTPGKVFRLGVDFVLPLSQEEQQQEEQEPTPKYIRRGRTRRLKFGT